jgi:hypothetical protein
MMLLKSSDDYPLLKYFRVFFCFRDNIDRDNMPSIKLLIIAAAAPIRAIVEAEPYTVTACYVTGMTHQV